MDKQKPSNAPSHRITRLAAKLTEKEYRDNYVSSHLRVFLAGQIKALRGDMSQAEFGRLLDKPQSVVSRIEDSHYGKHTLQTLLEIAQKRDVALLVRFIDYPTFIKFTDDFSDDAINPESYDQGSIDSLVADYTTGLQTFRGTKQITEVATNGSSQTFSGISAPNVRVTDIGTPSFELQSATSQNTGDIRYVS